MSAPIISLNAYKAHRASAAYYALPPQLRTTERARPLLQAVFDYTFEHIPNGQPDCPHEVTEREAQEVARKLSEFGSDGTQSARKRTMDWLRINMLLEAWKSTQRHLKFTAEF